jgi:hypothetical protein
MSARFDPARVTRRQADPARGARPLGLTGNRGVPGGVGRGLPYPRVGPAFEAFLQRYRPSPGPCAR